MNCNNPIYINTANVTDFGFATYFDPYLKAIIFDIAGYTNFKVGGAANITHIDFEVIDPQENTYNVTINPSLSETEVTINNLVGGLLFFGEYHIKGKLIEANLSEYVIEFKVNVCDSNRLTASNYIKGCVDMSANCTTAKLDISDTTDHIYNKKAPISVDYNAKLWIPTDPDGDLTDVTITYLPYQKNLSGYYTGNYQLSVTAVGKYEIGCNSFLLITFKSSLTKTIDCSADIGDLNCCWQRSVDIANQGGQVAGQMQEKLNEAMPYYLGAMGKYISGENAQYEIQMVNQILNCNCQCRKFVIQPAPITLGNANVIGECGTAIEKDENGDIHIHSFIYTIAKGDPTDLGFTLETTQINECTKRTTITFDYGVLQQNILTAISNNPTYINNWKVILGVSDCPCEDVELYNVPELLEVVTQNPDYQKLQPNYFVKSDVVLGVRYKDHSHAVGGSVLFTEYYDQLIQQQGMCTDFPIGGNPIILPCFICGEYLSKLPPSTTNYLYTTIHSECGCERLTSCRLEIGSPQYTERYGYSYRANFQITSPSFILHFWGRPGDLWQDAHIYFNDVNLINQAYSNAGYVRKVILSTSISYNTTAIQETRTLSGRPSASNTPITFNNIWGDEVEYFYMSSVNLNELEMENDEPAIYFATFGGVICRLVKERTNQCDERANWKTYVIGGVNIPLAGEASFPLAAGATAPANSYVSGVKFYGMKKFFVDENGNQTFILVDNTSNKIFLLYFSGQGSKNDASKWNIFNPNVEVIGSNKNCNVEMTSIASDGTNALAYIWLYGGGGAVYGYIKLCRYVGTNTIADLTNVGNYSVTNVCINGVQPSPTPYTNGLGSVATVNSPEMIYKVGSRYYFCSSYTLSPTNQNSLRYFEFLDPNPTQPSDYNFGTEIVANAESVLGQGTYVEGVSTTVSGATEGLMTIPNVGTISFFKHGIRKFDLTNKVITIISGNAVYGGNLVESDFMDTQFEYKLYNCDGGSGE